MSSTFPGLVSLEDIIEEEEALKRGPWTPEKDDALTRDCQRLVETETDGTKIMYLLALWYHTTPEGIEDRFKTIVDRCNRELRTRYRALEASRRVGR